MTTITSVTNVVTYMSTVNMFHCTVSYLHQALQRLLKEGANVSVYCAHPPRVQHGSHNGPTDAAQFPLETVLKYTCYPGYLAVGFAHAKCFLYNTTAQWFGPDLTCKRKMLF